MFFGFLPGVFLLGQLSGMIRLYLQVFNWGWTWRFWWDNFIITIWFIRGYDRGYVAFIKCHFSNFLVVLIFGNLEISQIISNRDSFLKMLLLLSSYQIEKILSAMDVGDECWWQMLDFSKKVFKYLIWIPSKSKQYSTGGK